MFSRPTDMDGLRRSWDLNITELEIGAKNRTPEDNERERKISEQGL
jgi:hypothetical protein